MKAISSKITKSIPFGARLDACDNSGVKIVRMFAVKRGKTTKRRYPTAGIGDLILGSVVKGRPDMRKQVVLGIIVRQKKEYKRQDGTRVKFQDNALIILKDDKGNPKGTIFKGPVAKEAVERWPPIGKIAKIVV